MRRGPQAGSAPRRVHKSPWRRGSGRPARQDGSPMDSRLVVSERRCAPKEILEATPGFEPGIKALQASALPLGYVAVFVGPDEASPCYQEGRPPGRLTQALAADLRECRWSGRRDSNPRPQPWQGCALPAEPRPRARGRLPCALSGVQHAFTPHQGDRTRRKVGSGESSFGCYNRRRRYGGHGRLAQGESTSLTRKGSEVQIL